MTAKKMSNKRDLVYILLFLAFVLALWMVLSMMPQPEKIDLESTGSTVDLSQRNFDGTIYRYAGQWESWPDVLHTPDAISDEAGQDSKSIDYSIVQYATHRFSVRLPEDTLYSLYMTSPDYSMRLYINGIEIDRVGIPGTSRETSVPRVQEATYAFLPSGEWTEFVIQTSNFVHGKSGCKPPVFYIGEYQDIARFESGGAAMGFLIIGCLLSAFLYHLGLFCLNRSRKPVLLFAFACLLLALMQKKLIFLLFPEYNWYIAIRVEYVVHFLTFVTLTCFIDLVHPNTLHRYVLRAYYIMAAVYLLLTFITDTSVFTGLLLWFELASGLMIGYIITRLAISFRGWARKDWLSFSGVLVLGLLGMNDMLYYRGIPILPPLSGQFFLTPIGMVYFVFCYAMVLSIEHAQTEQAMRLAREAEQVLAAENAALDRLNAMKTDLMATISHETRTPLAVMSNYAELIAMGLRRKGVDEQTAADLDKISDEILRIADLMEELQKFTGIKDNALHKERMQIADFIRQSARLYAPILERKNNKLLIQVPEDLPLVWINPGEITQVMLNILQNARNHTQDGEVCIDAEYTETGGWREITVSISDTGSGISPEFIPYAFERYAHEDVDGTGLGLSICREIIQAHGGTIEIANAPNGGAVVRFTLPVNEEEEKIEQSRIAH